MSQFEEDTEYVTPYKYKKQIRQRTFDLARKLPNSPGLKTAVVSRCVKKLINSPSTRLEMTRVIKRYSSHTLLGRFKDNEALQQIVLRIRKYKANKNVSRLNACVNDLKQMTSIRQAAKRLNIHYSSLHRMMTVRDRSMRRVTDLNRKNVRTFYSSMSISLQLPYKKYAKFYYLRTPLAVAYEEYAQKQREMNCRVLSRTSVYQCLKGQFRVRKKIPFKDCQCDTCLNNSMLVDALIVAGVKKLHRRITENIMLSYCPLRDEEDRKNKAAGSCEKLELDHVITDYKRDCIYRDCPQCGVIYFQDALCKMNTHVDWSKPAVWHQWEKVQSENSNIKKKSFDKIRYTGPLSTLLTKYIKSLHKISVHMFDFRWQAFQFNECKKLLEKGDCLFIIDFAQNHSHHRQDEILGAYWSRKQSTLHPFVIYFLCPEECGNLVKEEVMILSDDLLHDADAVEKFTDKVLEHLKQRNVPVDRVIIFSDNCASQYKCAKYFKSFTKRNIPFLHNHFGAKHGKAEADGAIGRLSQHIDAVTRSGTHEFGDCKELASYCSRVLGTGDVRGGMCSHYRKSFYEVPKFSRLDDNDLQTVKGTTTFHSVRNTGIPGIIEVRESSCFCEPCFLGVDGECKNKHLVKPFRWAKVCQSNDNVPTEIFKNKLWNNNSSIKYKLGKIRHFPTTRKVREPSSKLVALKFKIAKKKLQKAKKFNKAIVQPGKKVAVTEKAVKRNVSRKEQTAGTSSKVRKVQADSYSDFRGIYDCSDDSDFEDGLPLNELIKQGKGNDSVMSPISSRTRLRVNKMKFVRCDKIAEKVSLADYEGDYMLKKVEVRLVRVDDTVEAQKKFSMSGIQPLPESGSFEEEKFQFRTSTPEKLSATNVKPTVKELQHISPIRIGYDTHSKFVDESFPKIEIDLTKDAEDNHNDFTWKGYHGRILSCNSYGDLKSMVKGEKHIPPLPLEFAGDAQYEDDEIDNFSLTLIPFDVPTKFKNHQPVEIFPEGNCFFRSLSRLVYGNERHHLEMRCRVVDDLVRYEDNYVSHDYLMRGAVHEHKRCFHIGSYYCSYCGVTDVADNDTTLDGIRKVFMENTMRIRHLREYSDIWHLHSAANVLKSKIVMVFPDRNIRQNVRVDMNRAFLPSVSEHQNEYCLLWTAVGYVNETDKLSHGVKRYDHIVPMILMEVI